MSVDSSFLSTYANQLDGPVKERYMAKVSILDIADPYLLPDQAFQDISFQNINGLLKEELPEFSYPDLFFYLIHRHSHYTGEEMKSFKSLDAYIQMKQGWVTKFRTWKNHDGEYYLIMSKVRHSQSLSKPQLRPWIILRKNGEVETAHCTCMAGLGEACTHIAATLFALESIVKHVESRTCTSEPCYWMAAASKVPVPYAEGNDISYSIDTGSTMTATVSRDIPLPTSEEIKATHRRLREAGFKSAILSLVPGYSNEFAPKTVQHNLPSSLRDLYTPSHASLNFNELKEVGKEMLERIAISEEQALAVEEITRPQSKSNIWYRLRAGRITASNFKAVCRTDPNKPSISLLKRICYPEAYKFSTASTRHGCEHESAARDAYQMYMARSHQECSTSCCGLILHPHYPILGASPDGFTNCSCCGKGIIEIKCPYCAIDTDFVALHEKSDFCLIEDASGHLTLDKTHKYYYQVQLQLLVSIAQHCDFVLWREKNPGVSDLYVERIYPDVAFMQDCLTRIQPFVANALLPELVGKWFSRSHSQRSCEPSFEVTVLFD